VVRGLPVPIIYLRQRVDLDTQRTFREVVDGQQRLRTVFAYIDPTVIEDYDSVRDGFTVKPLHNEALAGRTFSKLPKEFRGRILSYEFSTHVLPIDIEDREVLEIFARLNATGVKLNHQELRNAEYFGEYKFSMYSLGLEQLDRWREWQIFTDDQISRMKEVELTSDLVLNMIKGLSGKTQNRLDEVYKAYNEEFPEKQEVERRFRNTINQIDEILGVKIRKTVYKSEVYFFTLFIYIYDQLYGLGSQLKRASSNKLKKRIKERLLTVSEEFYTEQVPRTVLDAVQRASSDLGRRKTRLEYMQERCNA
jgi:uncharacterized protein with ParB-like and HNH nuclease domain